MSRRVCSQSGCPALTDSGKCTEHRREADAARGTKQQRGYDAAFDQAKRAPAYVNATHCATCGVAFTEDNPKTAGHRVAIRNGGQNSGVKPECRRCNYGWAKTGS